MHQSPSYLELVKWDGKLKRTAGLVDFLLLNAQVMGNAAILGLQIDGPDRFFRSPSLPLTTREQSLIAVCTLPRCVTSVS